MRVLVIGSGGREAAIAWACRNHGHHVDVAADLPTEFDEHTRPDLVIVGYNINDFPNVVKQVDAQVFQGQGNLRARLLECRGAQAVVLGCTELPFAFPGKTIGRMVAVDPSLAFARALIREAYPERLKPHSELPVRLDRTVNEKGGPVRQDGWPPG